MPSHSLQQWNKVRVLELDAMEHAHHHIGGTGPGRRYATQQINHAYAMLLSSQFQGYCRDLHSECVNQLVSRIEVLGVAPSDLRNVLQEEFLSKRKLDAGNPNPGNLGEDFNRLGVDFWGKVKALDRRNVSRHDSLLELNLWRNAIAHQNFAPAKLHGVPYTFASYLTLKCVRRWRGACEGLVLGFDSVMGSHIELLIGSSPW